MSLSIHSFTALRKVMFLLNSRATLVIAPCNRIYKDTIAGIPYTEGTGPICRVPSVRLHPHTLGFSPKLPVLVLGMIIQDPISFLFTGSRHQLNYRITILKFTQVLIIIILPWLNLISIQNNRC